MGMLILALVYSSDYNMVGVMLEIAADQILVQ